MFDEQEVETDFDAITCEDCFQIFFGKSSRDYNARYAMKCPTCAMIARQFDVAWRRGAFAGELDKIQANNPSTEVV